KLQGSSVWYSYLWRASFSKFEDHGVSPLKLIISCNWEVSVCQTDSIVFRTYVNGIIYLCVVYPDIIDLKVEDVRIANSSVYIGIDRIPKLFKNQGDLF